MCVLPLYVDSMCATSAWNLDFKATVTQDTNAEDNSVKFTMSFIWIPESIPSNGW